MSLILMQQHPEKAGARVCVCVCIVLVYTVKSRTRTRSRGTKKEKEKKRKKNTNKMHGTSCSKCTVRAKGKESEETNGELTSDPVTVKQKMKTELPLLSVQTSMFNHYH